MFSKLLKKFRKPSALINHSELHLRPLQAFLGSDGQNHVVLDFKQASTVKILGTLGAGKSVLGETLLESLRRSTPGIEICIISLSGRADFLRFDGYENYYFFNPSNDRNKILEYFTKKNSDAQQVLDQLVVEKVRHAIDLKNFKPCVVFIDELESCFPTGRDAGESKKNNELIVGQINEYLKLGRKVGHLIICGSQTQTLSASDVALRLMHYTFLGKAQSTEICREIGIPVEMGKDPGLKEGKFILIGLENGPRFVRVARFR